MSAIPTTHPRAASARTRCSRRHSLVACCILTIIPLLAPLAQPARGQAAPPALTAPDSTTLLETIDTFVERERRAARVPGIALAIVQGDRIVHLQGFGQADPSGRAVTPQTPFVIGSAAKSVTALAVMQLVEAGTLELDTPVQRYLPTFRVADADASTRITVRHLLQHTSGLPSGLGNGEMATSRDMRDDALAEQVRRFSTAELTQPVGAAWQYSNAGYVTLGLLVQAVSGQSYERYVGQHIFAPLAMRHAFTDPQAAQQAGLASGYRYWFGRPVAFDAPFNRRILPAGLLMASGEDMAHYLLAQLNGGRYAGTSVLSSAGMAALQRGAVPVPDGSLPGLADGRYGMGWFSGTRNGVAVIGHRGDSANFHAHMLLVPASRYGIVLLMNANNRVSGERMAAITDGVLHLVLGQQPPAVPENNGMQDIVRLSTAIAVVQLLVMLWSAFTLRRLVRRGPGALRGWLRIVRYVVAPLVFYLLLALVFLVGIQQIIPYPWSLVLLSYPDLGTLALVCGVGALGWAGFRTVVLARVLGSGRTHIIAPPATVAKGQAT